jgi:hypothetical protein
MKENQKMVYGPGSRFYEMHRCALLHSIGVNLPDSLFSLVFNKNGFYRGKRLTKINYQIIKSRLGEELIISQRGRYPSEILTFGDVLRKDSLSGDNEKYIRSVLGDLTDREITEITGHNFCDLYQVDPLQVFTQTFFYCPTHHVRVNMRCGNSDYFLNIYKRNNHGLDCEQVGYGSISGICYEQDKFLHFIGDIANKFEATETEFRIGEEVINLQDDEQSFNLLDFAFYLFLTESHLYQLLAAKENESVIKFLNTFMQSSKGKYESLLGALETELKTLQPV